MDKDWLKKNGQKLKIFYSYAVVHKLNIKSKEDMLKILQAIDSENATEVQAEIYSKMLQLFNETVKKRFSQTAKPSKQRLVN